MTTLRETLRIETRPDHDRVDALYGALALVEREGLRRFLCAHLLALRAIEATIRARRPQSDCPMGLSDLARDDLRELGMAAPPGAPFDGLEAAHPDGLIYVVAGAHLGAGVLRKRWARATDPRVRGAGRYLGSAAMRDYWPAFVGRLNAACPETAEGRGIVAGAKTGFRVFEEAFRRAGRALSGEEDD